MDKFTFLNDNNTCIVNGKSFEVTFGPPFDGTTTSIEGTGEKSEGSFQYIDIADFKGIRVADLPASMRISIYIITTPFPYFIHWALFNRATRCTLTLDADFDYQDWKEPVNLNIFLENLKAVLEEKIAEVSTVELSKNQEYPEAHLSITFELSKNDELYNITQKFSNKVKEQFEIMRMSILNHDSLPPLIARFRFPKKLESACQQYLVYFAEFLRDLGIEVDTELLKNGNEILFSVIPANKDEALLRIKEALAFYLKLPDFYYQQRESVSSISPDMDIIVQKYIANIEHLRSQLRLAEALINTEVLGKKNTNSRFISVQNKIFERSLHEITIKNTPEDAKSFFGGIIKLGSWKKGPMEISTPKLLEGLKKIVAKLKSMD